MAIINYFWSIYKPGPIVVATTQDLIYCPFAAAGFAHDAEQQINQLCGELSGRFQVQRLAFGREVRQESHLGRQSSAYPAYAQEATDYARLFQDMAQRFSASSAPDAVAILISDGQANLGQEPAAAYRTCPFPLYCIGIGDTLSYPDIFIDECRFNPYTFLGNRFPLQIRIGQQQEILQTCRRGEVRRGGVGG